MCRYVNNLDFMIRQVIKFYISDNQISDTALPQNSLPTVAIGLGILPNEMVKKCSCKSAKVNLTPQVKNCTILTEGNTV